MTTIITDCSSELQRHFGGGLRYGTRLPFGMGKETAEQRLIRIKLQMRHHREQHDKSQREMAVDVLHISPDSYEKYEGIPGPGAKDQTLREPPSQVLMDFCEYFDLDFETFLNGKKRKPKDGTQFAKTPSVAELMRLFDPTNAMEPARRKRGRPKSVNPGPNNVPGRIAKVATSKH